MDNMRGSCRLNVYTIEATAAPTGGCFVTNLVLLGVEEYKYLLFYMFCIRIRGWPIGIWEEFFE